ncbi:unnamed protein product [Caenorhabditis nigoni]
MNKQDSIPILHFDYKDLNTLDNIDYINFFTTFINQRIQLLWSFLCSSSTAIIHVISTVLSQIAYLFCAIPNVLYPPQARFPLLKLDYVAIREVLSIMHPDDYINFLKVSKSCRRLSFSKKPDDVCVIFKSCPRMRFGNGRGRYSVMWKREKGSHCCNEPVGCIDCGFEYSLYVMKKFYLDARSVMSDEIHSVELDMDDYEGRCREIVAWLKSCCPEVLDLCVYGMKQRQEELQYVLDNLKFTNSSFIYLDTIENLPLEIPNTIEGIRIQNGLWITLNYVMRLEIRILAFNGANLTNQDINVFYKSWIEMESHQNLEFFEINLMNPEDFVAIGLRDIPYEMGSPIDEPFPYYTAIEESFEVTRNDGQKASICVYDGPNGVVACILYKTPETN